MSFRRVGILAAIQYLHGLVAEAVAIASKHLTSHLNRAIDQLIAFLKQGRFGRFGPYVNALTFYAVHFRL